MTNRLLYSLSAVFWVVAMILLATRHRLSPNHIHIAITGARTSSEPATAG